MTILLKSDFEIANEEVPSIEEMQEHVTIMFDDVLGMVFDDLVAIDSPDINNMVLAWADWITDCLLFTDPQYVMHSFLKIELAYSNIMM